MLAWFAANAPLTKSYTRRRFEADLDKILRRAARYGHGGAPLYFYNHEFKLINDTGGHEGGDDFLSLIRGPARPAGRGAAPPAPPAGGEVSRVQHDPRPL